MHVVRKLVLSCALVTCLAVDGCGSGSGGSDPWILASDGNPVEKIARSPRPDAGDIAWCRPNERDPKRTKPSVAGVTSGLEARWEDPNGDYYITVSVWTFTDEGKAKDYVSQKGIDGMTSLNLDGVQAYQNQTGNLLMQDGRMVPRRGPRVTTCGTKHR